MYHINEKDYQCSIAVTLDIFNDRWKLPIIWNLLEKDMRYKELHEILNEITQKTLTVKLKELEAKNIIIREVFPEVPLKVVYSLTEVGKELKPILDAMYNWGITYTGAYGKFSGEHLCETTICK